MLLSLLLLICVSASPATAEEPVVPASIDAAGYAVGEGDVLSVDVHGEPDFSGKVVVDHRGRGDFPFLGPISVGGLSASAVRDELTRLLSSDFLVEPRVSVWVSTYGSQPVRVFGAVRNPGIYFLEGPTTVSEMLARAGGVIEEEHVSEVQLRKDDGARSTLSLARLLEDGSVDLPMSRGDVLYLPAGKVVYLSGQVQKPGAVAMGEGLTVMQALTRAGGPAPLARLTGAYILRDGQTLSVNLRRIMKGRDADVALLPGDQVFLKKSAF